MKSRIRGEPQSVAPSRTHMGREVEAKQTKRPRACLVLVVSLTFSGHQGQFRGGSLYLCHVKLQLRQQVVFCLIEDMNGSQGKTTSVCKHHPLFLPPLPSWSTHTLCTGCRVPGHQPYVRQARAQWFHVLQQSVVITTEEGVKGWRVGQEDADGHIDRRDGTRTPRPQDVDDPTAR